MRRETANARLLKELKNSGQSVSEFSQEHGIPTTRLYGLTRRERERQRKPEGNFVRVIPPAQKVQIVVGENIRLEVPVEQLREVITALGIAL
jgi:transposase-like protein